MSATLATRLRESGLASPDLLVQKIDLLRGAALVVRMSRDDYRSASFLDDRILSAKTEGLWISLAELDQLASKLTGLKPLQFIFHAGHVGSTLLSRLLEEVAGVFSLREPLTLRQLAEAHDVLSLPESLLAQADFDRLLAGQLRLWQRAYPDNPCVVLKATSSAARAGPLLLGKLESARAIYLNLAPEPYLATLLAGENSPIDLRGHGPERIRRLKSLLGQEPPALSSLSLGEIAALSWLTERLTQNRLSDAALDRVLALDFDAVLADLPGALPRTLAHFGLAAPPERLARLLESPNLRSYSKAPEHAYTPALRGEILAELRQRNRDEIRRGLGWLERMGSAHATVAAFLR